MVRTPLDPKIINNINEKNKILSTILTVGASYVLIIVLLVGAVLIGGGIDYY